MLRKVVILSVVLGALIGWPGLVFAYDDNTTHPALTQEIIELYNLRNPDRQITVEEKELVISGSALEDTIPRMINHFYDPVRKVGWTGANAGSVPAETVKAATRIGVSFEKPLSAVEWAVNDAIQQSYWPYGGNRSWKRGLDYFVEDNRKEAFITLGHILHLIEDMGVPDHTRDDSHIHPLSGVTGDPGSPYEDYATHWTRGSIKRFNLVEGLKNENILALGSIQDYLRSMAQYSNKYFFSKDTVNDSKYSLPGVIREDSNFGYGTDEHGTEFPLVRIQLDKKDGELREFYVLGDKTEKDIFGAYFSRLSRQVVLHGVGVIELFLSQADDRKVNLEFERVANPVKHGIIVSVGRFASGIVPNISLVGLGDALGNGVANLAEGLGNFSLSAASTIKNTLRNVVEVVTSPVKNIASQISERADLSQRAEEQAERATAPLAQEENTVAERNLGAEEDEDFVELAGADVSSDPSEAEKLENSSENSPSVAELAQLQAQVNEAARRIENLRRQVAAVAGQTRTAVGGQGEEQEEEEESEPELAEGRVYDASYTRPLGSSGGGSSGGGGGGSSADTTAPSAITNLAVISVATSSVTLQWTAPGDDGANGTAALYVIRYATTTITSGNWPSAANLANPPAPLAAGASQSAALTVFTPGTTYYFAIKTKDEAGNESDLSNIASGTTDLPIPDTSNVNHVLISEVQVAGVGAGDEFIELYNPTDSEVNISAWSIQYLSGSATSTAQAVKKNFESGSVIGGRSYFLIARGLNASSTDGYTGLRNPDMSHRTFSLSATANGATIFLVKNQEIVSGASDADIVDRLAYGSGDGLLAESGPAVLPPDSQSLERKAWVSGTCVSASGGNEFSGNGCDTGNNSADFEVRSTPNPQNLANLPETRSAPAILNLSSTYSSSTMSADFSWTLSADARGATSTNIYTISKVTSTSTIQLMIASSTKFFSAPVSEDTTFEFKVQDWEGASRNTTTTISSSFYSYPGTVFEQNQDTEGFGALPQGGSHYFAQTFAPQRTGRTSSASIYLEGILGGLDGANSCSLNIYQTANPASTSTSNFVVGTGVKTGPSCASGNFSFATTTISAGTTYTLVFNYTDFNRAFVSRGTGDVIPGSYWEDGAEKTTKDIKFSLSGIVMSPLQFTGPPTQPQNLQTNFDRFNLKLDLSWDASTDSDSGFHYQINYTTSTVLSATDWRSVGTSTTASVPLAYPNTYKVGVRARDDFYNVSTSTVSDWNFPGGFSTTDSLAGQLDANHGSIENGQDGNTLNEFAQTFTVATTSVPYFIRLNTAKTTNGSCSVKIYAADSISSANSGNLIATTGDLGGGGNTACSTSSSKMFQFTSTGTLNVGTTYIWIYTARNGSANGDAVVTGFKAEGYPGVFSHRLTQNGAVLWTTTQPQTVNAYFELFGDLQ